MATTTLVRWDRKYLLNGGAGADVITGGSKNDVIVFDTNDTASVNGGAGYDILCVSTRERSTNSSFQVRRRADRRSLLGQFTSPAASGCTDVDLSTENLTNLEAIPLTAELPASSSFGTELHGLTASNVVSFTGGQARSTARPARPRCS